jgi:RNA 3'-terminal phosphate cyclase
MTPVLGRAELSAEFAVGPGNAVVLAIEIEHVTEVFTGFGESGRPAEEVAKSAIEVAKAWLQADVPVDTYRKKSVDYACIRSGMKRRLGFGMQKESELVWRLAIS